MPLWENGHSHAVMTKCVPATRALAVIPLPPRPHRPGVGGRDAPGHDGEDRAGEGHAGEGIRLRDSAEPGVSKPLLGKFPVFGIKRNTTEKIVACNTSHSFKMFYYLPESILYPRKLVWIFHIICNIRRHQFTVLDFNHHLPALRHADAQGREIGRPERGHRRVYWFLGI